MASMQLLDESKDALRLLAYRGFGPELGEAFELCGGDIATACNAARRERRRVIVPDVEASDFLAPMLEVHRRFDIRAVQSTPLISRSGELLGMISTHWRAPHEPQEGELRLLDVLARQAADLIERSRAEEVALHYSAIVASSDDAIVSKSLDGTIASWNAGAERIFGYTAKEAVGQSIRMIIPADRQAEEDGVLARLRRGERIDHFETIRRRKDGTEVPISLTVSPVKDRYGRIIGASKVARDISERRQAERMVADALAVKDEFIGLVSHELRTPVTTIAGNAAILARRDNGLDEEARRQAIEDVRNEADRLNSIIENLLMLARLDRGGIEPEPVALSHVLRRAARDQQAVNGRAIRIGIDEGGESVIVAGDQGLLGHVIGNYLSNAEKYSPPDSPIDVIMDRIDGAARVRVLDRGIGIDASEAERLFESFYRSKNVGRVGGVGVGLSVCRRLIRAIDGECWARAREGGGSEFGFSVPLYEE
jgi:PAS domain S-box-containing protein